MAKDFAKRFYASTAWHNIRDAYISSVGGLCEDCFAVGKVTPGKIVHHVVRLTPSNIDDASVTLSFGNLRLLCQDCHAAEHKPDEKRKHYSTSRRYVFDANGDIRELNTPPASAK